ncbi:ABC transporter permease [Algoriphagus mannitolivorans]|uniref:ABC transporter permease n=1 Tax=Algoriphagus mannitolivorans TaxID=226504 RepID=UPI000418A706|nr:FtsX-like permease family protein [Algoriphagus mannitolivorans]
MLKNYLKIAWRNILRNKVRTGIHVLGLSLGISICFLIFNVVRHAYSFDTFHPDSDQIYRINTLTDWGGGRAFPSLGTPGPLGEVIDLEVPGIQDKGRLYTGYQTLIADPESNRSFGRENTVTYADQGFFQIFPREWLAGNSSTALLEPNSVVISETSLKKYFPDFEPIDVLGKEMAFIESDTILAKITGVVANFTENTDFIFNEFISYSTIQSEEEKEWFGLHSWGNVNSSSQLFVKTIKPEMEESLEVALAKVAEKHYDKDEDATTSFTAEPLRDIHFGENYDMTSVSKVFLYGMIYIGLIILALATLNFINLETAHAMSRGKEVGIRKTLGGRKGQLIFQFLTETYLLVGFSMLVGLGLTGLLINIFGTYLPKGFELEYFTKVNFGFYLLFPLVLTLISGIYPALILSGYQPARALKGEKTKTGKFSIGVFLRKNLTVLQFSSSIAFIILVLVLQAQIKYVTSQPLGFEKEEVLYSSLPFMSDPDKMLRLQELINQQSNVLGTSLSGSLVSSTSLWTSDSRVAVDTTEKEIYQQVMNVDSAFIGVNGIPLLAGKPGSNKMDEILINENYLKEMGVPIPEEAINRTVRFGREEKKIVGVVGNFHSRSLREEIKPLIITYNPKFFQTISVKLQAGRNLSEAKSELEAIYKQVYPHENAEFSFLDEEINRFYEEDTRIKNVLSGASILAILISAMGLFGLSSFTIAQRTKEISIRKVLGATMGQILGLISRDYVILIVISFAIAVFPAYYFLKDWLNDFTYRIDMPFGLYGAAGLGVMVLCLMIVGLHSYIAVQTNPSKVLKDE